MAQIYKDIIETIGRTLLVKVNRVTAGIDATVLGPHKIQGTGAGLVPKNLHLQDAKGHPQIVECIQVANDDPFTMARRLAKEEGILAGISSGANVWAAIELAKRTENRGKLIVTIACSTGERYLSTALAADAKREVEATIAA